MASVESNKEALLEAFHALFFMKDASEANLLSRREKLYLYCTLKCFVRSGCAAADIRWKLERELSRLDNQVLRNEDYQTYSAIL